MANTNSDQINALLANEKIGSNTSHGRQRTAYFQVPVLPTSGAGDTVTLCKIPKGARVMYGVHVFSAAQGASATVAIGIAGNTNKYRSGTVCNAANTPFEFAVTSLSMGQETLTEETIIATVGVAALAGGTMRGYVEYVVD